MPALSLATSDGSQRRLVPPLPNEGLGVMPKPAGGDCCVNEAGRYGEEDEGGVGV